MENTCVVSASSGSEPGADKGRSSDDGRGLQRPRSVVAAAAVVMTVIVVIPAIARVRAVVVRIRFGAATFSVDVSVVLKSIAHWKSPGVGDR